jgi:hypothetical protein
MKQIGAIQHDSYAATRLTTEEKLKIDMLVRDDRLIAINSAVSGISSTIGDVVK